MPDTLHIVHGNDGKIIAISESKKHARPAHVNSVKTSEFEVPAKFAGKKLREFAHLLVIDMPGHLLKAK
jgi:hypothetical protein